MAHEFSPSDGSFISYEDAKEFTRLYRENNPAGAILAHFFGIEKTQEVLDQDNIIGIRIYNAYSRDEQSNLVPQLIVVAVGEDGKDIVDTNKILDFSRPCPPFCPENGQSLNK